MFGTEDVAAEVGAGTDVAIEASDLRLVRGDPRARGGRDPPVARDIAHYQGQPVLGVRLRRGGWPAQPVVTAFTYQLDARRSV